jgi:hypothetical protein
MALQGSVGMNVKAAARVMVKVSRRVLMVVS